ncbi:MAG: metallophosphoesterase [Sarcina sp.]
MIYVVSDMHNDFETFKALLNRVNFSSEDTLIINGDAIDRKDDATKMIKFILEHESQIKFIIGNHEQMFIDAYETGELLKPLKKKLKRNFFGRRVELFEHENEVVDHWLNSGGMNTFDSMIGHMMHTNENILNDFYNYLKRQRYYLVLGDNLFVHAGPNLKSDNHDRLSLIEWVENQHVEDLLWDREFYEEGMIGKKIKDLPMNIFIGHTSVVKSRNHRKFGVQRAYRKDYPSGFSAINTDFSTDKDDKSMALYCLDDGRLYRKLYEDITVFDMNGETQ